MRISSVFRRVYVILTSYRSELKHPISQRDIDDYNALPQEEKLKAWNDYKRGQRKEQDMKLASFDLRLPERCVSPSLPTTPAPSS